MTSRINTNSLSAVITQDAFVFGDLLVLDASLIAFQLLLARGIPEGSKESFI